MRNRLSFSICRINCSLPTSHTRYDEFEIDLVFQFVELVHKIVKMLRALDLDTLCKYVHLIAMIRLFD